MGRSLSVVVAAGAVLPAGVERRGRAVECAGGECVRAGRQPRLGESTGLLRLPGRPAGAPNNPFPISGVLSASLPLVAQEEP
eukprot:5084328-Pyramimonas_sp.AAC.2